MWYTFTVDMKNRRGITLAINSSSHRVQVSLKKPIYDWVHQQAVDVGCSDSSMCLTLIVEAKRNREMLNASSEMVNLLRTLSPDVLDKFLSSDGKFIFPAVSGPDLK